MKIYVSVKREKNHDGDKLLKVIADKKKIKNYSFSVNTRRIKK